MRINFGEQTIEAIIFAKIIILLTHQSSNMKAKSLLLLFLSTTFFLQSQIFPVETVVNNGLAA